MKQLEQLEDLERTMCSFLDRMKTEAPEREQVASFLTHCRKLSGVMEDPVKLREGLNEEETDRLVELLERLVKLNAILRESVASRRDEMGHKIIANRRNQKNFARQATGERTGGSCDLNG